MSRFAKITIPTPAFEIWRLYSTGCGRALMISCLCVTVFLHALAFAAAPACAQTGAPHIEDLDGGHYTIAVHTSGIKDSPEPQAIVKFVERRVREINTAGGVLGRRLKVRFFDDDNEVANTRSNVRETLADPRLIATIGIWSSSRGAAVVDDMGRSGVPFISEMSVESLFRLYPNVYTLAQSVREEVDVFLALAKKNGVRRIAYAGFIDDLFTNAYLAHLVDAPEGPGVVSTFWETDATQIADYDRAIDAFVNSGTEMIVLALGSEIGARFLKRMQERRVKLPIFVSYGSISKVIESKEWGGAYSGNLYELSSGGVANLNNERIKELARDLGVRTEPSEDGARIYTPRDLGYGARYADLVQLIIDAAAGRLDPAARPGQAITGLDDRLEAVRSRIAGGLASLREGRRYWEGKAQYWSFNEDRATSERSMLLWRTPTQATPVLHPTQFIRIDGQITEVPVLYLHLDMVRMFEVDTNQRTFDAEFYLTLRSKVDLPLQAIDFTNAFRTNSFTEPIRERLVATFEDDMADGLGRRRIYHVTGRFQFRPDLAKYPFDRQLLTISFQPVDKGSIFILQPPAESLRNKAFEVEDWQLLHHYVGTTDRIITSVRGHALGEHVIPYYNFNYTWIMKREVVDYLVRVIVPLGFILVVAYLAAYIPRREFNATIAIQVTALLSAIALYFALNQPNSDDVTLSDKIFVSAYAIVSLMIALSIFEIHEAGDGEYIERGSRLTTLRKAQLFVVPFLTCAFIGWLIASAATDRSIADGIAEAVRWVALAITDYTGK
ncbi:MAG: ABC transporter substrate-binding protein [Alphaproteobacteria bacterium]|nr:ABC transporter substrate-binding protein [Alphaproteobacteria bacterium]